MKGQYSYSPCYETTFYIGFAPEGLLKRHTDFYGNKFIALTRTASTFELQSQNSAYLFSHVTNQLSSVLFQLQEEIMQGYQGVETSCQRVCTESVKVCTLLVSSRRIIRTRIVRVARMGERRGACRRSLRKRYHLEGIVVHGRILLKWIFKKCDEEHVVVQLVEALRYKLGCRRLDSR